MPWINTCLYHFLSTWNIIIGGNNSRQVEQYMSVSGLPLWCMAVVREWFAIVVHGSMGEWQVAL